MRAPVLVTHLSRHERLAVRRFAAENAAPRAAVVHDHATIALFLAGRAKLWLQGLYTLGPGDLLLVPDATSRARRRTSRRS